MHVNSQLSLSKSLPKKIHQTVTVIPSSCFLFGTRENELGVKLEITQQLRDNEILCCTAILVIQLRNQRIISAV